MNEKWVLKCGGVELEALMDELWECPGVLGMVEAESATSEMHAVPEEFDVLEFGSKAAKKWIEYIDYKPAAATVYLHLYLDTVAVGHSAGTDARFNALFKTYGVEVVTRQELVENDYLQQYRDSVNGMPVGRTLWVGPPWAASDSARRRLVVEPGLAFGTGDHPTTQLILEWLEDQQNLPISQIFDLGTGSGVLALGAQSFWPDARVFLSDNDPQCREVVARTIELNPQVNALEWKFGFGDHEQNLLFSEQRGKIDLVISNIYAEVLLELLDKIEEMIKPGGYWVASGILAGKREKHLVRDSGLGFQLIERRVKSREHLLLSQESGLECKDEEWVMLAFQKR